MRPTREGQVFLEREFVTCTRLERGRSPHLSKNGLRLENEIIDDATQSTPQTLITIEATGYEER